MSPPSLRVWALLLGSLLLPVTIGVVSAAFLFTRVFGRDVDPRS